MIPRPIEIIGGGLAGLSLGLALRRAGVPVTLHEAGRYPRHRVCGEFITGLATTTIARLGLEPFLRDALAHREVAWFAGGELRHLQRLPSPALGISRHVLDARLAAAFVAAGGRLHTNSRVVERTLVSGRVLATGRRTGQPAWLGLKFHVRRLELARDLELHLGEQGYVGLARVEPDTVNVCGLFRQRPLAARGAALMLHYLRACGLHALAQRLGAHEIESASVSAVAALDFEPRPHPADRIQLGDACALIPPFTGNGMAMAFQSAEIALAPLLAYARGEVGWQDACTAVNTALRRKFRLRLASANALHPFLLQPRRQRWLMRLSRARLLPFRPLYAALH